jgi:hypothetical protein
MSHTRTGYQWELAEMASTILSPSARRILKYWIRCPEFLDASQHPGMLGTAGSKPGENWGFQCLVREVDPLLAPTVILNELRRKHIVEMLDSGQVLLKRSAYAISNHLFENEFHEGGARQAGANLPRRRYNDAI